MLLPPTRHPPSALASRPAPPRIAVPSAKLVNSQFPVSAARGRRASAPPRPAVAARGPPRPPAKGRVGRGQPTLVPGPHCSRPPSPPPFRTEHRVHGPLQREVH